MVEDQLKDQLEVFSSDAPMRVALLLSPGERAPAGATAETSQQPAVTAAWH